MLSLRKWCPGAEFDAYTKRQFVTESTNINSLADHHIWSTIKTLPATLPEPSSRDRGPRTRVTGTLFFFTVTLLKRAGRELDNHSLTLASAVQKCVGN